MCAAIDRDRWRVTPAVAASPFGAHDRPRGDRGYARVAVPPTGLAVLLVEGCAFQRLRISKLLAGIGSWPYVANDADGAAAVFGHVALDIVLVDVQDDPAPGLAATVCLRELERRRRPARRVPVLGLVSNEWASDARLLRDAGIDAVIDRAFDAEGLQRCIRRWCPTVATAATAATARGAGAVPAGRGDGAWTRWVAHWLPSR